MTEYRIFSEHIFDSKYGDCETYGVVALRSGKPVRIIGDISADREQMLAMIALWNDERLELCHLSEAVEDFLCDQQPPPTSCRGG